jgi:hypothetical protein
MSGWDVSSTPAWDPQDGPEEEDQPFPASGNGSQDLVRRTPGSPASGPHEAPNGFGPKSLPAGPPPEFFAEDYGQQGQQDPGPERFPQRTPGQSLQDPGSGSFPQRTPGQSLPGPDQELGSGSFPQRIPGRSLQDQDLGPGGFPQRTPGRSPQGQDLGADGFLQRTPGGSDQDQDQDLGPDGFPQRTPSRILRDLPRRDVPGGHPSLPAAPLGQPEAYGQDNGQGQPGAFGRDGAFRDDGASSNGNGSPFGHGGAFGNGSPFGNGSAFSNGSQAFGDDSAFSDDGPSDNDIPFRHESAYGTGWGGSAPAADPWNGASAGNDNGWGQAAGRPATPWDEGPQQDARIPDRDTSGLADQPPGSSAPAGRDFGSDQDFGPARDFGPPGGSGFPGQDFPGQAPGDPAFGGQDFPSQAPGGAPFPSQDFAGQEYGSPDFAGQGYNGQAYNGQAYNGQGPAPAGYTPQGYPVQGHAEGYAGQDYARPDRGPQEPSVFGRPDRDMAARMDPALQDFFAPQRAAAGGGPGGPGGPGPGRPGEPGDSRYRPADGDWGGSSRSPGPRNGTGPRSAPPAGRRGGLGAGAWIAIGAVIVVVIAVAAYLFLHKPGGSTPAAGTRPSSAPSVPAAKAPTATAGAKTTAGGAATTSYVLSAPATAGGYPKGSAPNFLTTAKSAAEQVTSAVTAAGAGTFKGSAVSAAYDLQVAGQVVTFIGYPGTFTPAKVAKVLASLNTDQHAYPAGPHGGILGCDNTGASATETSGAVCVWATGSTLGITEFFSSTGPEALTTSQDKGASDTVNIRADVETKS